MRYYICLPALCLLIVLASVASSAIASGPSVDIPVSASFQVSGAAKATDNTSAAFSPGPGKIDILKGDGGLYIRVSAPAGNGTRLISMDDYESGITFRNNTMLLPLYSAGVQTGALVVTTDNLTADANGYAGMVTSLGLASVKIVAARDGHNFTASIVISMTGLPAGATYRVAFADNASLSEAVSADLAIYGQAAAATSPALDVSASVPAAGDMISFVFATFETDENWTGHDGDKNITFYRYAGGQLSRLPFTAGRSDSGSLTYQAISTGAGQFLIVDAAPRDLNEAATAINSDIVMLGGLLATLVIALGIMVRRVIKR